MRIYHGIAGGRVEVAMESATEVSLETALAVFDALVNRPGFLGLTLEWHRHLRFHHETGVVRIELVDLATGSAECCRTDAAFARSLIYAAAAGRNAFAIAHAGLPNWTPMALEANRPGNNSSSSPSPASSIAPTPPANKPSPSGPN